MKVKRMETNDKDARQQLKDEGWREGLVSSPRDLELQLDGAGLSYPVVLLVCPVRFKTDPMEDNLASFDGMVRVEVLVAEDKKGTRLFRATTRDELHASALKLVRERAYTLYEGEDREEAIQIVEHKRGMGAWDFLQRRTHLFGEGVRLGPME